MNQARFIIALNGSSKVISMELIPIHSIQMNMGSGSTQVDLSFISTSFGPSGRN